MRTVGAYEAKTHLPRLLNEVAQGSRITITKHGVPIAILTPPQAVDRADPGQIIEEIRRLRKGRKIGRLSLRRMIEEGRRY
jgi:prevent-host-death family protein